jgi:hypothetical protein
MLDKIQFQNGTIVTKEYLNEVQKGTSFSATTGRANFYAEPTDSEHTGWSVGQRDSLKDWEVADPREDNETAIGRLAHDGIVLNSYDPITGAKVWGPPALIETSPGSGVYGVWIEAGSIVLSDGQPVSWGVQFVQLLSGVEVNYLYISEQGVRDNIAAGESVEVSIGSALPSVSKPHIPLAKLTFGADGTSLATNEDGEVAGAGYVDLRPSLYIGNLNTYPRTLRNTETKKDSYIAQAWERVIADTSNGSLIVSLPPDPTDSDRVAIVDISGTFDRFPVVIRPSGDTKINGSVDDWIVNIRDTHLELFYHAATSEWKFEETPGGDSNPVLGTFLSCGGKEFIGQRLSTECPDNQVVPAIFPNTPDGVYRYEASTQKCYKEYYPKVAIYANGEGGLISINNAPRCLKDSSAAISAASVKNIIYVDPAVGDDSLSNNGFDDIRPFRTIERALIEAVRESRRAGQYNDRYDRVMIELAPGDYYVDNSPGVSSVPSLSSNSGLIQRVFTGFTILQVIEADRSIKINIDALDPTLTQPPKSLNLGRILYSQSGGVGNVVKVEKQTLSSSVWTITLEYVRGTFAFNDELYYDNLSVVNPSTGGLVVPRGISVDGVDLRKVRIRPMYVPELTPTEIEPQTKRSAIFKVTGGTYISLLTFTDNPQYARTHNTVTSVTFASEAEIFGSGDEVSYYSKLNSLFNAFDGWGSEGLEPIRAETTIVAPIASSKNLRQADLEENQTGLPGADSRDLTSITYPGPTRLVRKDSSGSQLFDLPDINSTRSSSPYVFNCSVRSIFGLNGMWVDGALVSGFKSMVTANYTQVSLQTDPNCFNDQGYYLDPPTNKETGQGKQYRISPNDRFKYRHWGFRGSNDATIQIVSCFVIGNSDHFIAESGADLSITNSCSDFGDISLRGIGYKAKPFSQDQGIPGAGYLGTRLTQVIPPLPLKYACKKGETELTHNCFSTRQPTLVDTEVNTSLVINYEKTEAFILANAVGFSAPNVIRVYFDNADNANPFTLENPPSADIAAFGQFSYTKKNLEGQYFHAGGITYVNRRRLYINGFDEDGNSIVYSGEIQIAPSSAIGFEKLDDRSKVFAWDDTLSSWYFSVKTNDIVEEIVDNDEDGYLIKKLDYAFRFKLAPGTAPNLTISNIDFIFDRSAIKIIRGIDSRKNDERVYRIILEGFDKKLGIRRPQPYYVLEKQSTAAGFPLNGSSDLIEDPLTITQIRTYNDVFRPGVPITPNSPAEGDLDKFITYLTTGTTARQVFSGDVFPPVDLDEPELTEDPADSITKITLQQLQERPGVSFDKEVIPSIDRFNIKLRENSTDVGILVNLRRPSVIRASGHTWEWTGYLNYDTAFPTFQGDPLEQDFALGKIIVEETGGRVYATGMNEEGSYYIGTTVFDLRSGEQFAIPLKADAEPGNVTNQVLNNVIVKNTLLMGDDSKIIFQDGTQIILNKNTEIVSNVGPITAGDGSKSYGTIDFAGLVQLAKRADIEGARNAKSNVEPKGVSDKVVVSAYQLAQELNTRLSGFISAGTGVTVQVTPNTNNTDDEEDDFNTYSVSIGQDVATSADVTFNRVTATTDICAFSDIRLKQNVLSIDNSLSKIEGLRGVSYELKSDPGVPHLGLIAQEVKNVVPEVVLHDETSDMYKVSYQSLIPVLIEAVKELSQRVKDLENRG